MATHCELGDQKADIFVNDDYLISFDSPPVTSEIEANPGTITALSWDNGAGNHPIQNPENYSYSVEQSVIEGGIFVLEAKNLTATRRASIQCWGRSCYWHCDSSSGNNHQIVNGFIKQGSRGLYQHRYGRYSMPKNSSGNLSLSYVLNNSWVHNSSVGNVYWYNNGGNMIKVDWEIITAPANLINQLIVNDDGTEYEYSISDPGSVQEISGETSYTLTLTDNNGQSVERIYTEQPTVTERCRKDCPPQTCLKIRCGSRVCCYGSDGTILETVDDPEFEINAC